MAPYHVGVRAVSHTAVATSWHHHPLRGVLHSFRRPSFSSRQGVAVCMLLAAVAVVFLIRSAVCITRVALRSSFRINMCMLTHNETTLCLKKVPTFKLSVTLSNVNQFSKFLHCWKAYEICYKSRTILPTSL